MEGSNPAGRFKPLYALPNLATKTVEKNPLFLITIKNNWEVEGVSVVARQHTENRTNFKHKLLNYGIFQFKSVTLNGQNILSL